MLKRVAVDVGEAGDRPPPKPHGFSWRRHILGHRFDASGLDFDEDVFGSMAEPRLLRVPHA